MAQQNLFKIISAQSASATTGIVADIKAGGTGATWTKNSRETAIYVVWGAGTSSGVVTVETAHDATYAGTWANLATDTWSAESSVDVVQITGVMAALRVRISTVIGGGTVDVWALSD